MSVNSRTIKATPEQVWDVLADGWIYPVWVVGATRMRDVDATWPQVGAKLHHSVGVWPATVDDNTEVLEVQPVHHLKLRARAWPLGEAEVTMRIIPDGDQAKVEMAEDAVSGRALLVPRPVRNMLIKVRNVESLRRLAFIAEHRGTT